MEVSNYAWPVKEESPVKEHIKVVAEEGGQLIEVPRENDDTVLLCNVQKQFARTVLGLKYKGPSGAWRAVREGKDAELLAPKRGWGNQVYCLTFLRKRKRSDVLEENDSSSHNELRSDDLLKDLAVIRLPYEAGQEDIRDYFEKKYGGVADFVVKTDSTTGKSLGYGFIRFNNEESARKAIECEDDEFMGWKMSVKPKFKTKPMKMFVNSLPEGTTTEDLVEYFSQFGKIIDSCVPQPFRSFGFFTFASTDDGQACLRVQHHTMKSHRIMVLKRTEPGSKQDVGRSKFGGQGGFSGGWGGFNGVHGGFSRSDGGFTGSRSGLDRSDGGFNGERAGVNGSTFG